MADSIRNISGEFGTVTELERREGRWAFVWTSIGRCLKYPAWALFAFRDVAAIEDVKNNNEAK